jgi:RNA polymerase sigma-70 factor (ECF subfamily)
MDLIQRCLAGDEEAFATLYHQYKNLVYKTAYLMLGNAEEAEDILQEVFLRVYRSLHTYRPSKGALTTWLNRITVNRCLKRRRKRRSLLLSLDRVPPSLLISPASSLEGRLTEEQSIQGALRRLSEKLQVVVVLRYYQGLSYAEISQVLDIPLGTVKSRLNLALKNLRQVLDAVAEETPDPSTSGEEVSI